MARNANARSISNPNEYMASKRGEKMTKAKKDAKTMSKGRKPTLFFVLNIAVFAALLVFVMLRLFVFNEPMIPDSHSVISVPPEFFDIGEILTQPYEEVTSVSTKYSILYRDGNYRKMYVFAVSVREVENDQYYLFDNKIYENVDGTYGTRNKEFNVSFGKNSVSMSYKEFNFAVLLDSTGVAREEGYRNTYGETREAAKYAGAVGEIDMRCVPTYNGVLMEFGLPSKPGGKELTLEIDIGGLKYENDPAGYAQILKDENKAGMMYQGIVSDSDNICHTGNKVKITEKNKKHYLTVDLSGLPNDVGYPARLAVSFDFYCEKMFYDTSAYEATPGTNSTLNNVTIFDTINEGCNGYTYLKYNVKSFTPKQSSMVDSFTFNFYVMSAVGSIDIEVYRLNKDFCNWLVTWKKKPNHKEKLGEFTISGTGWHSIDLTEYVKNLIDRNYDKLSDNSIVLKPKNGSEGYALLASADNTYAPPFFEVNYRVREQSVQSE